MNARASALLLAIFVAGGAARAAERPTILTNLGTSPDVEAYGELLGIERAHILYDSDIDPEGEGRWTRPDRTDVWLDERVPVDYEGYVVLDWEAGVFERLRGDPEGPGFAGAVGEMVRLAEHVKAERPAARIGYYGLPITDYWSRGEAWEKRSRALAPLFDVCDALFPSVYDYYGDQPERDARVHAELVRMALDLAGEDPVFLYTYHRYDHAEEPWAFGIIPEGEYFDHVTGLLLVESDGRRPAGVVAWGMEDYYQRAGFERDGGGGFARREAWWERVRAAYNSEMFRGEAPDAYRDRLHRRVYLQLFIASLRVQRLIEQGIR